MQVPPSPHGAPRLAELHPGIGTMHTPHVCDVGFPASSVPRHVACVQVPASHGCPTSGTGQATGSQNPHGCWLTAPSSWFSLLHVDAMQTPTHCGSPGKEEPNGPQDLPNSEGGHDCADAAGPKSTIARASAFGIHFMVRLTTHAPRLRPGSG